MIAMCTHLFMREVQSRSVEGNNFSSMIGVFLSDPFHQFHRKFLFCLIQNSTPVVTLMANIVSLFFRT